MYIVNISEIRQNASKIVTRTVKEKEPTIIMQRSKPVAYILDADVFEDIQKKIDELEKMKNEQNNKNSIQLFDNIREKTGKYKINKDSVEMIREVREDGI